MIPFPVKGYPELDELGKIKVQVQILVAYLDRTDPQWRQKIKDLES